MQQNQWPCQEHAQQISKICIDDHQCQDRRLCIDCILDTHKQVDNKKMPSIQEFMNLLNNKLKDYKQNDFKGFFKTIESLQSQMNLQFENIKKQIQCLIEILRLGDQPILELKEQLIKRPLLEFSRVDYNYMKDILEGNVLQHRINWRQKCKEICQDQIQGLQNKSQLLLDQFEMMTQNKIYEKLERNVKLQGQVLLGLKQGEFYYVFDDGSTDYAGNYEFGIKQGVWNDYLGYNKQKGKRIFNSAKYLNGVNLGQDGWALGQFDYEFNKIEIWQEVKGVWNQLILKGKYQKGVKVCQWQEYYGEIMIGCGDYNSQGQKVGMWTEALKNYQHNCQVTFCGEYKNGIRFGQWSTKYKENNIGGGTYDDKGVKIGQWTDLHQDFNYFCQVTFCGEYKNGIRFGKWSTKYKENNIGGGTYDDKGLKIGQWTDLHQDFRDYCQVTFCGDYKNGIRIGKWSTKYKENIIGGGTYDDKGLKIGRWTDLHQDFHDYCQVTFCGEYKNGQRIGYWNQSEDNKMGFFKEY